MSKVVTLGEVMLRLSPCNNQRFVQADRFEVNYGGGEANVAASLAQYGHTSVFVTKIPGHTIGDAAIASLRRNGIDCSQIVRGGRRLGVYYLENGTSVRPSTVIYDREGSAIADASADEFDFKAIFTDADLLHISGITPVISRKGYELARNAMITAKKMGLTVSFDLNYRQKLWQTDIQEKQRNMEGLMEYADICFGNAFDAARCLGYSDGIHDFMNEKFDVCVSEECMSQVTRRYKFRYLVASLRNSISASDNGWSGVVCDGSRLFRGQEYHLHIVDRVGGGDALVAGFLHQILEGRDCRYALDFAIAAGAIKHTIPGDINLTTQEEVESLMDSGGTGRVIR